MINNLTIILLLESSQKYWIKILGRIKDIAGTVSLHLPLVALLTQ